MGAEVVSARRSAVRAALGFGLLFVISHPGVLGGSESWFDRDFGVLGHPTVHYWRASILSGELPLWNPLSNCGVPFLAQWGTMALYPGLALCLLPLPYSLNLFCVAHLWLGAVGMFRLARSRGSSDPAAWVAGTVFAFCGLTQACLAWPNYCAALGWMPWVVSLTITAGRCGGGWMPAAAIAWALQIFAGAPEVTLMTALIVVALMAADWTDGRGKHTCRTQGRPGPEEGVSEGTRVTGGADPPDDAGASRAGLVLGRLAATGALALGLTAAQTLPFLALLADSQRLAGPGDARWGLTFRGLANLVLPLAACFRTPQGGWFQLDQQFFASTYLGLPALGLALLAAGQARNPRTGPLLVLAGLGLILAMANPLIVTGGLVRFPVKFLLLTGFAVALLAGQGLEAWKRFPPGAAKGRLAVGALVVVVAATALAWQPEAASTAGGAGTANSWGRILVFALVVGLLAADRRKHLKPAVVAAGLVAGLWADYRWHLPGLNPTLPARLLTPSRELVPARVTVGEGRAFIRRSAEAQLVHSRVRDVAADYLGKRLAHWSHLNLLDDVPKVNGSATLRPAWEDAVQSALYATDEPPDAVLDFLGVRWVSDPGNPTEWTPRAGALPLLTAGQRPVPTEPADSLRRLLEPEFDPARSVLLPEPETAEWLDHGPADAAVESVVFEAGRIRARVRTDGPTWLVVAQTWAPGWEASVNEVAVPVMRANHAFQALPVPAGESRVSLRYRERRLGTGALISLISLGLALGLLVRTRRRKQAV